MARPLRYELRILLRLSRAVGERVDQALEPGEVRADFFRVAIERELQRRATMAELAEKLPAVRRHAAYATEGRARPRPR